MKARLHLIRVRKEMTVSASAVKGSRPRRRTLKSGISSSHSRYSVSSLRGTYGWFFSETSMSRFSQLVSASSSRFRKTTYSTSWHRFLWWFLVRKSHESTAESSLPWQTLLSQSWTYSFGCGESEKLRVNIVSPIRLPVITSKGR